MELSLGTWLTCGALNGARELEVSIKAIHFISFTFVNVSAIHDDWIELIFDDFSNDCYCCCEA